MPYTPRHQDIGITLANYEEDKLALKSDAATRAYGSIINELSCRKWFEKFENFPDTLPREVRTFFYVLYTDNEVNNGGFSQYFGNGYGRYAADAVRAFNEIGAAEKAGLLAVAMASFPDSKYPQTSKEWDDIYEKDETKCGYLPDNLDDRYYQSTENIDELMVSYVKEHFTVFAP